MKVGGGLLLANRKVYLLLSKEFAINETSIIDNSIRSRANKLNTLLLANSAHQNYSPFISINNYTQINFSLTI